MIKFVFIVLAAAFAVVMLGCQGDEPGVVARVGHYKLTSDQMDKSADPEAAITTWMEDCLLALEAESRGIDNETDFAAKLERIKISLLASYLIELESAEIEPPFTEEVENYYQTNEEEFRRAEPEVEFVYFSGLEASVLSSIKKSLSRGMEADDLAEEYPGLYFGREAISDPASMPEPFSSFAQNVVGTVLGPMEIGDRYYIFKISQYYEPGTMLPLSKVRDLIVDRIMEEARQEMREKLLKELRGKYNPSINMERLKAAGISMGDNQ